MRRLVSLKVVLLFGLLLSSATGAAGAGPVRVLMLIPPVHSMASEFFPLVQGLEAAGLMVDVAAWKAGPYLFWEDSYAGGDDDNEPDLYNYVITKTYDAVQMADYDALILGPGHAHGSWNPDQGRNTAIAIIRAAVDTQPLLGAVSFGVLFLVANGFMDGRSVCAPPHYQGIIDLTLHIENFLKTFDVSYAKDCVHIDETDDPVVVTAGYGCVRSFVATFAEEAERLLGD